MSDTHHETNGRGKHFNSVSELKDAHSSLLKRQRYAKEDELLDDIETFVSAASATGVVLEGGDEREMGQSLIDYWVTLLYRAKRTPTDPALADFDPALSPKLDDSDCPYLGLSAFQEKNKDHFYGRRRLVEQLVAKLDERRMAVVVGPSGSGKSSAVLAGMIPALKAGALPGSADWLYLPRLVPGSRPLKNLSGVLRRAFDLTGDEAKTLPDRFMKDNALLPKLVSKLVSDKFGKTPAVLVVDQFEEVYTLCADDEERAAFINNLIALSRAEDLRHLVVLTLRADYETRLAQNEELMRLFETTQVRIAPLAASELRDAIEEPARRAGLKFEDGVVDALVNDILGEPAALPLLQYTLLRLWKTREDGRNRITMRQYRQLGGARRALSQAADEFYNKELGVQEQDTARRIMLRLVRPSGNEETTSNRVKRGSLDFHAADRIEWVLKKLHAAGLVQITFGEKPEDDQIEVAHEALVRNWETLVDWIEKERVNLRQRLRLTAAAEFWFEHEKDEGGLLGGTLLEDALKYDDLNTLERDFVNASVEREEKLRREKEDAEREKEDAILREQELEREKALALTAKADALQEKTDALQATAAALEEKAAEEARAARRLRRYVWALVGVSAVCILAAVTAFTQTRQAFASAYQAEEQSRVATEQTVIAEKERRVAETEREKARTQERIATDKAKEAGEQKEIAVVALAKAETESKRAQAEAKRAAGLLIEAQKATAIAKAEKKKADDLAKQIADSAAAESAAQQEELRARTTINAKSSEAPRLMKRGKYNLAISAYSDLLKEYEKLGERSSIAETRSSLSRAYRAWGDEVKKSLGTDAAKQFYSKADENYSGALTLLEEDLKKSLAATNPESSGVFESYEGLAQFYLDNSKTDEAARTYEAALAAQSAALKPDDYYEMAKYEDLATSLVKLYEEQQGAKAKELEDFYERRAQRYKEVYGERDTVAHRAREEKANFYFKNGRFKEAEKEHLQALSIVEALLKNGDAAPGDAPSARVENLIALADTYKAEGEYPSAEARYREAIVELKKEGFADFFLTDGPKTLPKTSEKLGDVLKAGQKYADAAEEYTAAATAYGKFEGDEDAKRMRAYALVKLAAVKLEFSKDGATAPEQKAPLFREAVEAANLALDTAPELEVAPDASVTTLLRNLAESRFEGNVGAGLEQQLERLVHALEKPYTQAFVKSAAVILGGNRERASAEERAFEAAFQQLNELYNQMHDFDRLTALYAKALEVRTKLRGNRINPTVHTTLNEMAEVHTKNRKYQEARETYQKALAIVETVFGKDSAGSMVVDDLNYVAAAYRDEGNLEASAATYERAINNLEKKKMDESSAMAMTLQGYVETLRLQQRYDLAQKKEKERAKILKSQK